MNQEDKELISKLAVDLKGQNTSVDQQASRYIKETFSSNENSLYQLTQAVLLQKHAIDQLKSEIQSMQNQPRNESFLGRMFGGQRRQAYTQSYAQPRQTPFSQGSFLGSALSTATGVAGGMFLFEGLNHLFSGGSEMGGANVEQTSFLDDSGFVGQTQDADLGFGSGDTFMDDSSTTDFGGFDDSSDDWSGGF